MQESVSSGGEDVYETFNIVMRRKPKENNFKAVLETIRELMNTQCVVPGVNVTKLFSSSLAG
jgi:intron-binding protein aquarius